MRILICAQQAPLPPTNGFRLQVAAVLAELRREHEVQVVALGFPDQDLRGPNVDGMRLVPIRRVTGLERVAGRLSAATRGHPFGFREFAARLNGAVLHEVERFRPHVVHVAGSLLATLGRELTGQAALLAPLDAAHLNADARVVCAHSARQWLLRKEASRVRRFEATEYRRFRRVVVVSREDGAALTALDSSLRPVVIPNGVDPVAFAPAGGAGVVRDRDRVIFAGVMAAAPNVSAADFLARAVMPRVRAEIPGAHLVIVGREPVRAVSRLSRLPGIEVVGEVDDMRAWLTSSSVCACPMLSGTGIKNKLLEGMASGLPCVVTPRALRGMAAVPGRDVLVGRDAEQLAEHVAFLLSEPAAARSIGAAGRAYVVSQHTWRGVADAYVRVYEGLLFEARNARTLEIH
jgi:glycosyltransferase involved in cell wall biosynthesis